MFSRCDMFMKLIKDAVGCYTFAMVTFLWQDYSVSVDSQKKRSNGNRCKPLN